MWNGFKFRNKRRRTLPPGLRVYALGDVHGRLDLLEKAMSRIDADLRERPCSDAVEIYLGDYIDRGPASRGVLDRLIMRGLRRDTVFLKGNHETYPRQFLEHPEVLTDWGRYGGLETLVWYGLRPPINADAAEQIELAKALKRAIPAHHWQFLEELKLSVSSGDFFSSMQA